MWNACGKCHEDCDSRLMHNTDAPAPCGVEIERVDVLWFSRHPLSVEQLFDLERAYGPVRVVQIDRTIQSGKELMPEIEGVQVVAVVAPLNLQQELLGLVGDKPLLICKSKRILTPQPDGTESKVVFAHDGWFRVRKIEIELERL